MTQNQYRSVGSPIVFGPAATAWAGTTVYAVGIRVTNGGLTYFCLIAHTSGTFATDLAAGKWLLVTPILWTPASVAAGAGRISAVWDRGAGNLPERYWTLSSARWAATPAAGDALRLYLVKSLALAEASLTVGNFTLGDAGVAAEGALSANAVGIAGPVVGTATDTLKIREGVCQILSRYLALAGWNSSATKALTATASDHWVMFTPMPPCLEMPA